MTEDFSVMCKWIDARRYHYFAISLIKKVTASIRLGNTRSNSKLLNVFVNFESSFDELYTKLDNQKVSQLKAEHSEYLLIFNRFKRDIQEVITNDNFRIKNIDSLAKPPGNDLSNDDKLESGGKILHLMQRQKDLASQELEDEVTAHNTLTAELSETTQTLKEAILKMSRTVQDQTFQLESIEKHADQNMKSLAHQRKLVSSSISK